MTKTKTSKNPSKKNTTNSIEFGRFLRVQVAKESILSADIESNAEIAQCEVIGVAPAAAGKLGLKKEFHDYKEMIDELVTLGEFNANSSYTYARFSGMRYATHSFVVGLGKDKPGVNAIGKIERIRRHGANVANKLIAEKAGSALLFLDTFLAKEAGLDADAEEAAYAFIEGMALAAYKFDKYITGAKKEEKPLEVIILGGQAPTVVKYQKGVLKAEALFNGAEICRDLGNEPSNQLHPPLYAERAKEIAKQYGLKCTVFDEKWIKKENMGLLMGVGQGSINPPRLVVLEYKPAGKAKKHMTFLGKGVTFDSGGISIKPSAKMEEMKYDMCGSAACVGAIVAAAKLKLPVHITAVLSLAENMPDANAIQPGNILVSRSGKTVEVINTDAEGRLVLADALDYIQTEIKPDYIIDLATLTGAATVTFGKACAALMSNDETFGKMIKAAAKDSGERVWELPLFDEYFEDLKCAHADMRNSGDTPANGTAKGAMFLLQFIKEGTKWAHLDIASVANGVGGIPYYPKASGTAYGVRLLFNLAANV